MTALADLSPDTHPVSSGVREIGALLDTVLACSEPVPAGEVASVVEALERIARRAEALTLRLLAERPVAEVATREGYADTGSWLARRTRTTRRDAARATQLAEDLTAAPATGVALGAGDLSPEHARVITGALAALPATLTDGQRASVEADLVAQAARTDPARLRRAARRALAVVEPDPAVVDAHENDLLTAEEDTAHARARLTFHDNGDGTLSGHFTVPRLAGDVLRTVVDAMTAPRRRHGRLPTWLRPTGRTVAAPRLPSCSSTCPPTT